MIHNSPFLGTQAAFGASPMHGAQGSMMQMMFLTQMMQLMMSLMSMMSGQHPMGSPSFGQRGGGGGGCNCHGGSPANFLGLPSGGSGGGGNYPYAGNGGGGGRPGGSPGAGAPSSTARTDVGNPQSAGNGYIKPLDGNHRLSSGFGPRRAPTAGASTFHKGVDLAAPTGTPVRATKGGRVSISTHQTRGGRSAGYGNWIEVKHDDGTSSRYGHLNSRDVQVGQRVKPGQVIGTVGNTGTSTGAHLHFEIRNAQGQAVDPQKVMKF